MRNQKLVDAAELVRHIDLGLRKAGLKITTADARPEKNIKKKIFAEIAILYGISERTIRTSALRGQVAEARILAILLINKHLCLPPPEIARLFSLGRSIIEKRIRAFQKALSGDNSEKVYGSRVFIAKFGELDKKINQYKRDGIH